MVATDVAYSPYPYYQRAYAQAITTDDGTLLYPTYCATRFNGQLHGAIHCSRDGGRTWQVRFTLERKDGNDLDEPSIAQLREGRLMMITRLDAAIFYSEDAGLTWEYSHCAPFAPLKASRLAVLADGTLVIWMTSYGKLRVSWSCNNGATWQVDSEGKPFAVDPEFYGYSGGFVMKDESVFAVYYDAANKQQRTSVWAIRFQISPDRSKLTILPLAGASENLKINDGVTQQELDVDVM